MKKEIDPKESPRGRAFELWKTAAMPKVTIFKTFDISRLIKVAKRSDTSALAECEIDGVVSVYSELFTNPFLAWGKYRRKFFKTTLPISFQFHHAQMDGFEAARFLNEMQKVIDRLKV